MTNTPDPNANASAHHDHGSEQIHLENGSEMSKTEELNALRLSHEKKVEAMKQEIKDLEKSILEAGLDCSRAFLAAEKRALSVKEGIREMEDRNDDEIASIRKASSSKIAGQNSQIYHAGSQITALKYENKKLKTKLQKLQEKFKTLMDVNTLIEESSFSLAEAVDLIGDEATNEVILKESFVSEVEQAKAINRDIKERVVQQQKSYMEQAEARLELQKTLVFILNRIQEVIQDNDILEKTAGFALDAESAAEVIMGELAFETSLPSLAGSEQSTEYSGEDSQSTF
jgi:hypothetical protein